MEKRFTRYIVEIWLLYFFGALAIAARIYCRTKFVGTRGYQLDDYIIVAVFCMWTAAPVIGHIFLAVCEGRHTSQLTHEQRQNMPPEQYHDWEYGSQIFLFGLSNYFIIIWTLKFNMLLFYERIVRGLWVENFIKPVMGLVLLSAVVIVLTLSLYCHPFHALWQVWPDPGSHCVPQNEVFFTIILAFNLLTDICIMLIPAPVIIGLHTSRLQKVGLVFLFSLGFFCMFAAILRYVLVFHLTEMGVSALWSMREDFVGIVAGQLPLITPMLKRKFWINRDRASDRYRHTHGHHHDGRNGGYELDLGPYVHAGKRKTRDPYSLTHIGVSRLAPGSEEEIVIVEGKLDTMGKYSPPDGSMIEHTAHIEESP
ncbi:uncharacterized protein GGS22DRAFT_196535 [Annulohypoxylon maeteangense]|uniref:uncharacterized protein n=1 Tax=Annulohypoxylon maeteangense TaxID=1927788 RepID=UPI002007396B|nr:uncharacterized protein GGS22DRAFT_196535 [Annulohypoxylon maeteangense]KAI0888614.1 hypothetical protein GGS22DRAFT_196535 [Annulohypoxylon maeteangense]